MSGADARRRATFAVVAGAWALLVILAATPGGYYVSHQYEPASAVGQVVAIGLFLSGWVVMCMAMMLPTAGRMLVAFDTLVARRADRRGLTIALVGGFLTTWLATGYLFRTGDVFVHLAVDASAWLRHHTSIIEGGTLVGAGLFQLSDLKHRCLTACRAPRGFLLRHWHGDRPHHDAFRVGVAYGTSCVGCCWALMLVMFGVGAMNFGWMLVLTALMAAEKNLAAGPRMARPLGFALVALGAVVTLA